MTVHLEVKKIKESQLVIRGEIYFADMGEGIGSEQNGIRPVLVLQNDVGNKYSPTTIVALITSISKKMNLPVHYEIRKETSNLPQDSVVLLEQIRTIDKKRLLKKVSLLNEDQMEIINRKILISLGMTTPSN
jgi:mRNA interferase MazF